MRISPRLVLPIFAALVLGLSASASTPVPSDTVTTPPQTTKASGTHAKTKHAKTKHSKGKKSKGKHKKGAKHGKHTKPASK